MKKYILILLLLISCTSGENTEVNSNEVITEETTTTKGETVSEKTYNQPHEMNIDILSLIHISEPTRRS